MRRYVFQKLVRDKMLEHMEATGDVVHRRPLKPEAYLQALEAKVQEEVQEVFQAPHQSHERLVEIGDVLEVLQALVRAEGASWAAVEALCSEKREARGTFGPHTFCEVLDTPRGSPSDQHCSREGARYPVLVLDEPNTTP